MERERTDAEILERTADGNVERYTNATELTPAPTAPHDRIDWFAATYDDPSKSSFVLTFRNVLSPRETWEADAKKPAAFMVDGMSARSSHASRFSGIASLGSRSMAVR